MAARDRGDQSIALQGLLDGAHPFGCDPSTPPFPGARLAIHRRQRRVVWLLVWEGGEFCG